MLGLNVALLLQTVRTLFGIVSSFSLHHLEYDLKPHPCSMLFTKTPFSSTESKSPPFWIFCDFISPPFLKHGLHTVKIPQNGYGFWDLDYTPYLNLNLKHPPPETNSLMRDHCFKRESIGLYFAVIFRFWLQTLIMLPFLIVFYNCIWLLNLSLDLLLLSK